MPLLATLLQSLFGSIAGFFADFIGKRLAISMTAIATLATMTAALYGALSLLLHGIVAGLPDIPGVHLGIWVACPDNLPACFSALLSTDTTIALYRWNLKNISFLNK